MLLPTWLDRKRPYRLTEDVLMFFPAIAQWRDPIPKKRKITVGFYNFYRGGAYDWVQYAELNTLKKIKPLDEYFTCIKEKHGQK